MKSFQREMSASENTYPELIKDAEEDGEWAAAPAFSHARDVKGFYLNQLRRRSG